MSSVPLRVRDYPIETSDLLLGVAPALQELWGLSEPMPSSGGRWLTLVGGIALGEAFRQRFEGHASEQVIGFAQQALAQRWVDALRARCQRAVPRLRWRARSMTSSGERSRSSLVC